MLLNLNLAGFYSGFVSKLSPDLVTVASKSSQQSIKANRFQSSQSSDELFKQLHKSSKIHTARADSSDDFQIK